MSRNVLDMLRRAARTITGARNDSSRRRPNSRLRMEALEDRALLAVTGIAFIDGNMNGAYDAGETPLADMDLTLHDLNNPEDILGMATTTDANGEYTFDVPDGDYRLQLSEVSGLEYYEVTRYPVTSGGGDATEDFPFWEVTIGAYEDLNNNGSQDLGEPGAVSLPDFSVVATDGASLLMPVSVGETLLMPAGDYILEANRADPTDDYWSVPATTPFSAAAPTDFINFPLTLNSTTDLMVTTTDDVVASDGLLSLSEALIVADLYPGATIEFDSTLAVGGQITIATADELSIPDQTTISGASSGAEVIIDGGGTHRVFSTASANVTLESLAITGGAATGSGGAIFLGGASSLMVDDMVFDGNMATEFGGAICGWALSSTTLNNSVFTNNAANWSGGAVYTRGVLDVNGGQFGTTSGPSGDGNAANSYGGAICVDVASGISLTIDGASFVDNSTMLMGGAISVDSGELMIGVAAATTFSDNRAMVHGGGLYLRDADASARVVSANLSGNMATSGGAVYADAGAALTVDSPSTVLNGNTATKFGGAICGWESSSVVINDGLFTNNTADYSGGAVYTRGVLDVNGGQFGTTSGLSGDGNTAGNEGGAICIVDAPVTASIDGASLVGNSGFIGAGVYVRNSFVTIGASSMASGNTAASAGGALYLKNAGATASDSSLLGNVAEYGGAIFMSGVTSIVIEDVLFDGNTSVYYGGALCGWGLSSMTINDSLFTNNIADWSGGAVYTRGVLDINGSQFGGNTAGSYGGAVCVDAASGVSLTIDGSSFVENSSNFMGGAISVDSGQLKIGVAATTTFTDNMASVYGGALYLRDADSSALLGSAALSGNIATSGGAVLADAGAALTVDSPNSVFDGNTVTKFGGAICGWASSSVTINDGLFTNNAATWSGGAVYTRGVLDVNGGQFGTTSGPGGDGNTAGSYGGAICVDAASGVSLTIDGSSFVGNSSNFMGGAISVDSGELAIGVAAATTLSENSARLYGGGLYLRDADSSTLVGSTSLSGNTATSGGAVFADAGAALTVGSPNAVFDGNTVTKFGGAICGWASSSITINDGLFTNNAAAWSGGAVYTRGMLDVNGGQFGTTSGPGGDGNTAGNEGGAICIADPAVAASIDGASLVGNSGFVGGGIYVRNGLAAIGADSTVTASDNTAASSGGALYLKSADVIAHDLVLSGNMAAYGSGITGIAASTLTKTPDVWTGDFWLDNDYE